ncbi:MAG: hypothetical protein DMF72_17265 [Acidobacteria bacterium]|nr:MAG: hypothetical protein DMF72_17265 [Acidobacteriota bacterium]
MARSIVAVIVGYVVMFILNFLGFVALYAVIGPTQAFQPGLYLASNKWIAISFVIIFITGTIAGLICAVIAKAGKAPLALAIVVVVIGLLLAIPAVMKAQANAKLVRTGDVPSMEAVQKAYWPTWTPFTFPIISAIGVLLGGKLKRRS